MQRKVRRTWFAAAGAAAALSCLCAAPPADAAGSAVQFGKIQYDSPGKDTGSNTSLNAEWVVVRNYGTKTVNLYDWTVTDAAKHTYRFGSTFYLRPGHYVTIHTGHGTNSAMSRYWNQSWYVWNNTGDKAYLRRPNGSQSDYCSWYSDGAGWKQCTRQ